MKAPHLYAPRDPSTLEPHYSQHVAAMTSEGLHAKSLIAAEMAFRDQRIAKLMESLEVAVSFLEMDDYEVGDDVYLWLHAANDLLREASEGAVAR